MFLFFILSVASALQTLPPLQWAPSDEGFSLFAWPKTIYIQSAFASHREQNGLTLIPPSAYEFADTFRQDLLEITGSKWDLQTVDVLPDNGIILDIHSESFQYENGQPTEEGYEITIEPNQISIRGSGSRGMWWGTRTLLQQILLHGDTIPSGRAKDSPSYATRGYLLDAGRKWYSPEYLKDLCTYASFFKMSEFHYHTSDNFPLSRGPNVPWNEVYSQFALHPENPELFPLVQRPNETLSRTDFEDVQSHCAQRGVTVIPEIEAPGHCLSLTKWKPDLALDQKDLLNLSHPETIPLVKSIWTDFLPWFQTKEVHIGADEYDSSLADDYINFVNEMAEFMNTTSGKRIRIWGTPEPSQTLSISPDVIVQHWQYGQSDPVALADEGHEIINSEDWWAYMSLKNDHMPIYPAPYPYLFNNSRLLNFAYLQDLQWQPSLFNPLNMTEQPRKNVRGAIMAAWNDNGPAATTQLEAFYALRDGIPTVASRAWTRTKLNKSDLAASIKLLTKAAGSKLDRQLNTKDKNSVTWLFDRHSETIIGYGSKGMNYTLELEINGPFVLSSNDVTLTLRNETLLFISDGWEYPLRSVAESDGFDPGYPGRIWANQTSSSHEVVQVPLQSRVNISTDVYGGSRVWVDGKFLGRFEVFVYGGKNELFSWSQMAFVAPLERVRGLKWLKLFT